MKESVLPLEPGTWWGTLHTSLLPGWVIYLWMWTHSRGGHYPEKHRKGDIVICNITVNIFQCTYLEIMKQSNEHICIIKDIHI